MRINVFSQWNHFIIVLCYWSFCTWRLCGCCSRGSLFGSTTGIHSDFKYSMNWECPATYRPNLCLCRGAFHMRRNRGQGERGITAMQKVAHYPLRIHFKPFTMCLIYLLCVSPAVWKCHAPHPATLFLSPPLYLQCISVRKCLRTFHGSERQRKTVISQWCSSTSPTLMPKLRGKYMNTFLESSQQPERLL